MKNIYGILVIGILLMAMVPNVGASVILKTDKLIYKSGENINFTVNNSNNYVIKFDNIMIKNLMTGKIISTWCSPDPNAVCAAIYTGPNVVDPWKTYTKSWYLNEKGSYQAYLDWSSDPTVACMAIGCPQPQPGNSGRSSTIFTVR